MTTFAPHKALKQITWGRLVQKGSHLTVWKFTCLFKKRGGGPRERNPQERDPQERKNPKRERLPGERERRKRETLKRERHVPCGGTDPQEREANVIVLMQKGCTPPCGRVPSYFAEL